MPRLQAVVRVCNLETAVISVLFSTLRVMQSGGFVNKTSCAIFLHSTCVCLFLTASARTTACKRYSSIVQQ